MDAILRPRSIAVIGASRARDSVGHEIVANLVAYGFTGPVYSVNPRATSIHSIRAYQSLEAIGETVDLAVIVVPQSSVLDVVDASGRCGVRGVAVISAGFREVGGDGVAREQALADTVRRHGMRMVGPNCLGVLNSDPAYAMNATFAPSTPPPGPIGFVSQSGALGLSILDHAREFDIGIAQFVSVARAMIAGIRSAPILAGVRERPPADIDAIADALRRLSQLAVDIPAIQELDINPLLAREDGAFALDARVTLSV